MAGENIQNEDVNDQKEEVVLSVDEEQAMRHGWVPKDQWGGNPEEWIPAKVFNMRGDLFSRIAKDKKEISELRQTVGYLVEDRQRAFDTGYKQGLTELRAQRREALEAGDVEKAEQIEDKIDEFKEEHAAKKQEFEKVTTAKQPENPIFDRWHAENDWYLSSPALTTYANELVQEIVAQAQTSGVQADYPKLLQEITRKVRQKFPEKFGGSTKQMERKADAVDNGTGGDGGNKPTKRSSQFSESDLNDQERSIMATVLKSTGMTKEEYLKQVSDYAKRKG